MHLHICHKGGNTGECRKRSDSGHILKVGLIQFPEGLEVCNEKSSRQEEH